MTENTYSSTTRSVEKSDKNRVKNSESHRGGEADDRRSILFDNNIFVCVCLFVCEKTRVRPTTH